MTSKEKCTNDFAEREKEINDAIKSLDYEKTNELLKKYNIHYILRKAINTYTKLSDKNINTYIRNLIKLGGDINWIDEEGRSILEDIWHYSDTHFCIDSDNFSALKELIGLGLNINREFYYKDGSKESLFYKMLDFRNYNGILFLKENYLNLNMIDFQEALRFLFSEVANSREEDEWEIEHFTKISMFLILNGASIVANDFEIIKLTIKNDFKETASALIENCIDEIISYLELDLKEEREFRWLIEKKYLNIIDLITTKEIEKIKKIKDSYYKITLSEEQFFEFQKHKLNNTIPRGVFILDKELIIKIEKVLKNRDITLVDSLKHLHSNKDKVMLLEDYVVNLIKKDIEINL